MPILLLQPHYRKRGPSISPILAENSWEVISNVSRAGDAQQYWGVGDEKDITLTTGETLTLQIYDFDHDDLPDGGKAGITFGMKGLMAETRRMEAINSNKNGFIGSEMYAWLTGTLAPSLPRDLQDFIRTVNKNVSAGDQSTTILTEAMNVFLFSEVECFGTITHSAAGEGDLYPVFTDNKSRQKWTNAGTLEAWWLRSPGIPSTLGFCALTSTGTHVSATYASRPYGICFGFCI